MKGLLLGQVLSLNCEFVSDNIIKTALTNCVNDNQPIPLSVHL